MFFCLLIIVGFMLFFIVCFYFILFYFLFGWFLGFFYLYGGWGILLFVRFCLFWFLVLFLIWDNYLLSHLEKNRKR